MGGVVMRDFTDAVTHLIAGEVGSKKYAVACSLGKSVMLPEWVFNVWEEAKTKHILATDEQFDKFKCPIFKGCTICVTGLDGQTRQDVKKLCQVHGGIYSGELNMNTCTHLLVNMPRGEKYEFARKWNIHCVSTQWFYDCVRTGFWLDEVSYRTLPEEDESLSQPGSRLNLSATANSSISSKSGTERLSTKAAQAAYKSAKTHGDGGLIADGTKKNRIHSNSSGYLTNETLSNTSMLDGMDLNFTLKPGCMFLDGCKIFLSGFSGAFLDKIRKFINVGGGTRFNMINEIVSHVIIGARISQDIEVLKKSDFHPHVVTAHWIVDSAKNGKRMPEEGMFVCLHCKCHLSTTTRMLCLFYFVR
jgi:topoisomerase (DNA) II binding protein 1